jgi:hypothetical protein
MHGNLKLSLLRLGAAKRQKIPSISKKSARMPKVPRINDVYKEDGKVASKS